MPRTCISGRLVVFVVEEVYRVVKMAGRIPLARLGCKGCIKEIAHSDGGKSKSLAAAVFSMVLAWTNESYRYEKSC